MGKKSYPSFPIEFYNGDTKFSTPITIIIDQFPFYLLFLKFLRN